MNGSPELLEFYLVEATEYVDSLDQLVGGASSTPDANAFIATARALRGSSTMAKAEEIAELSLVIEQIAHALRDGQMRWTLDLFQSMRGTVDDLRFLVRGVRMWGAREDARTQARLADLKRFFPSETARVESPSSGETAPVFVALQASAIAAELDAFVQNSANRRALDDALTRARTLRGIAGISDYAPLADVADAVERTGRALMPDASLAAAESELFRAAAAVLRRASDELRAGRTNTSNTDEVTRFARAVSALQQRPESPESVVAIDSLYYADAGPHIVERRTPPTTPEQRFRQETSSRGEHLSRLVNDARLAHDAASRARVVRDLVAALRDIERVAASFGAHQVAGFFGEAAREPNVLGATLLDAIDAGARIVRISETSSIDEMERRLALLERARRTPNAESIVAPDDAPAPRGSRVSPPATVVHAAAVAETIAAPSATPSPVAGSALARKASQSPTGRELQALLGQGIAAFAPLDVEPLLAPLSIDDDVIVPIESLLYRGSAALDRAIHLRDAMRARGMNGDDSLRELFDLLDLARSE